jgi:PilZ domain-containing protein
VNARARIRSRREIKLGTWPGEDALTSVSRMIHPAVSRPRRRASRRGVFLSCQVVRERDFKLIGEFALDLSLDGMLVASKERVLTGEELLVSFRAPRSDVWIDAEAEVARVVHGRRPSDAGHCLGLSFIGLGGKQGRVLREALRGLPLAEPGRSGA